MNIKVLTVEGLDLYDEKIKDYIKTNVYDDLVARISALEEMLGMVSQEGYELLYTKSENSDSYEVLLVKTNESTNNEQNVG